MTAASSGLRLAAVVCASLCLLSDGHAQERNTTNHASVDFFESRIRPVLVRECYECHSVKSGEAEGGLLLDNRAGLLEGGDSGPAVVPGDVEASLLISAIRHEDFEMPLERPPLAGQIVSDFVAWVKAGATDPRDGDVGHLGPRRFTSEERNYWAFRPPRAVTPPDVRQLEWSHNIIDRFVRAALDEHGLEPSEHASKSSLIRRLYFDVLGLPPTPAEIEDFLADSSSDAYERLVDRLLTSKHYGEKWGQLWLDVVRFAETEGFEYDRHLPDAWRFRDYVIRSFNDDKPFDQFIREQIAGDEVQPVSRELMIAAGFHRLGPVRRNAGNPDIALSRNEVLTERTDIVGSAILGLTVGCARCHDHKFDPVSQRDYYALQAYLASTREHNEIVAPRDEREAWEAATHDINQQVSKLDKLVDEAEGAERVRLKKQISELKKRLPSYPATVTTIRNDASQRTAIHVLKRGVWERKGELVGMRPPGVLIADDIEDVPQDAPTPRTRLANWLVSAENPLTARVIVNRIWQGHFGVGLVKSANDFGHNGERPSHPELLDHLAVEFMANGWRIKPLHRLILTSRTYRQSSATPLSEVTQRVDPDNRLLWRFNRRRLSAEEIRDAMLSVSGRLNREMYGESIMLPVDQPLIDLLYKPDQWKITVDRQQHYRRSIYLIAKRNLRMPFMEVFDQPTALSSCALRESSTHAPQALELLNGRISNELALFFAERLQAEAGTDRNAQVRLAYQLATGDEPTQRELKLATEFLETEPLRELALTMFNINAFLYSP